MLDGIRIVEFEGLGPAPFAGMMLADLGAEVIVVHRPQPPSPDLPDRNIVDRGKKSIVLDLKDTADLASAMALIEQSDGLIEGFRPGTMERLGLGPDEVMENNPSLVYGRMTGWGQHGPKAAIAGHDLNFLALSGALWYSGHPGTPPAVPPTLLGDIGGGAMYLINGMLAGLLRASRTGQGTVVDAAIVDGSAHMMNLLMSAQSGGVLSEARGTSILDGAPWSRCYACADGGWLAVQCLEPAFYELFLQRLGVEGDDTLDQSRDPQSWSEIARRFQDMIASKTLHEWSEIFEDCDACVTPVLAPSQAALHPHLLARKTWTHIEGQLQARSAPRFDGKVPDRPTVAPRRGEHTEEILRLLKAR